MLLTSKGGRHLFFRRKTILVIKLYISDQFEQKIFCVKNAFSFMHLYKYEAEHYFPFGTPFIYVPGRVAQSVTCLATDACLTADPGVASSIPARSHTFVEIDHGIISTVILLLPLIYSRRVVVSYK